jgi:hypothetical protein
MYGKAEEGKNRESEITLLQEEVENNDSGVLKFFDSQLDGFRPHPGLLGTDLRRSKLRLYGGTTVET